MASDLRERLKEMHNESINEIVGALQTISYDENNNTFDTKECIICMEPFINGVKTL